MPIGIIILEWPCILSISCSASKITGFILTERFPSEKRPPDSRREKIFPALMSIKAENPAVFFCAIEKWTDDIAGRGGNAYRWMKVGFVKCHY